MAFMILGISLAAILPLLPIENLCKDELEELNDEEFFARVCLEER